MTACPPGGDTITVETTVGRINVTNLPGEASGYVLAQGMTESGVILVAASSVRRNGDVTLGQIAGGSLTLSVWIAEGNFSEDFEITALRNYNGSDTVMFQSLLFETDPSINVFSMDDEAIGALISEEFQFPVTFTDGVANFDGSMFED